MKLFIRIYFLLISLCFLSNVNASVKINVSCEFDYGCSAFQEKINGRLDSSTTNLEKIREVVRSAVYDERIRGYEYEILQDGDEYTVNIFTSFKRLINEINFSINKEINFDEIERLLPYGEGRAHTDSLDEDAKLVIQKFLQDKGHRVESVKVEAIAKEDKVDLLFIIKIGDIITVKDVILVDPIVGEDFRIQQRFDKFRRKPWDKVGFKVSIDELAQELFNAGYFQSIVSYDVKESDSDSVSIQVKISLGQKYNFSFTGNKIFSRSVLLSKIYDIAKDPNSDLTENGLISFFLKEYEKAGIYHTEIKVNTYDGKDKNGPYKNIFFEITEGKYLKVKEIILKGNDQISDFEIKEIYEQNSSTLASRGYYDRAFLDQFVEIIKKEYFSRGYVFCKVGGPYIRFEDDLVYVEYKFQERRQTILKEINFTGVSEELQNKFLLNMKNKISTPLNIVELDNDLNKVVDLSRNEGHYFAVIKSDEDEGMLTYTSDYGEAALNIGLDLGEKIVLKDIIVTGTSKTKDKVIFREIDLNQGETITPEKVNKINERITSLNLFSRFSITPIITSEKNSEGASFANLFIQVKENDFGVFELAPGFRTDIGIKLSASVSYNNLWGANRTAILKAQGNQRLDYDNFDERRKTEETKRPEFLVSGEFFEPYIFNLPLRFGTETSFARKRFYSFDADIIKTNVSLTKSFSEIFSMGIQYQLEVITQFDATDIEDDGYFRMGGVTPSISIDLRDDKINPKKGAFFGLTFEYVAPAFYSMNKPGKEINFYKAISRNKFYVPIGPTFVWATFLSFGLQENLAKEQVASMGDITNGFIPDVKVFRLDGLDNIRGYRGDEANFVPVDRETKDISKLRIDDKVYFSNIKVEPRYYAAKDLVFSLFFDAGNVYVNSMNPGKLKTAVGMGFKYLTPVGSLDFDYGIKLKRRNYETQRDSVGRLQLSIGTF